MTIEELLKDAWLKSWEVSNFGMKYLFEEYLNKRQSAINQAKREVISDFTMWTVKNMTRENLDNTITQYLNEIKNNKTTEQ